MKIEICPNCGGEGEVKEQNNLDHEWVSCDRCLGSGMIAVKRYTMELPFPARHSIPALHADQAIVMWINKIRKKNQ